VVGRAEVAGVGRVRDHSSRRAAHEGRECGRGGLVEISNAPIRD
jgi:hypothetical protein